MQFCFHFITILTLGGFALALSAAPGTQTMGRDEQFLSAGFQRIEDVNTFPAYVYVPEKLFRHPEHQARVLAIFHGDDGIYDDDESNNAVIDLLFMWRSFADRQGWILVAPKFRESQYRNDHQRFNVGAKRSDLAFNQWMDKLADSALNVDVKQLYLFGFSGGGQFVHRYAAFYPNRVAAAVASSSGWYLWPDTNIAYPVGIKEGSYPADLSPSFTDLCRGNLLTVVGEGDFRIPEPTQYNAYDLHQWQGGSRVERARNWVNAVKLANRSMNHCGLELVVLPNLGHDTDMNMVERSIEHFLNDD